MSRTLAWLMAAALMAPAAATAQERERQVGGGKAKGDKQAESATEDTAGEEGDVRTEGDTKVKAMEFSGLDIEGQLKTPQMLHFLKRLRAEFGRPRLPHRSFMPELQRSTRGKSF